MPPSMSDLSNHPISPRPEDDPPLTQRVIHQPVTARVPERVGRGVFSTGQLVLDSPKEFCIDFLFGITRPYQVVARVIVAPATMAEFTRALEQNLGLYQKNFGQLPAAPTLVTPRPPPPKPSIDEIYQNFKLPEDVMGGVYANSVMISHTATEFCFDFIAGFYPTSVVNARVLVAAPNVPRFLNTLRSAINSWKSRTRGHLAAPTTPPVPASETPLADIPPSDNPPSDNPPQPPPQPPTPPMPPGDTAGEPDR